MVRAARVATQRCGKHMSAVVNQHPTIGKAVISMEATPRLYNEDLRLLELDTRVEAGSNTSTVALRVVGGDEKGSVKYETVKDGHESHGTRTREILRW
jgi:hypothetical protein